MSPDFPGPIERREWQKTAIPARHYRIFRDVDVVPEEASHSIFFPMYFQIFIKFGTAKKPSKGPQMALNVLV